MCNVKCATPECDNIVDKNSIWCDECLKEKVTIKDEFLVRINSHRSL
jgi:hypothetical protein